jgi:hypothetical protein
MLQIVVMDAANGKMAEWQSGSWVKNCEKIKYPHYCNNMNLNNATTTFLKDVCKDCHKEHFGPDPRCEII